MLETPKVRENGEAESVSIQIQELKTSYLENEKSTKVGDKTGPVSSIL